MNFIGMLNNHKMRGSRYVEITEEAQLVTKVRFDLKAVNETQKVVFEKENVEVHPTCLLTLIDSCNRSSLDAALNDQSTIGLI